MRAPSIASVVVCWMIALATPPAWSQGEGGQQPGHARGYWIGVRCFDLPDVVRAQLDLAERQGVLVDDVVPDSPAEKAGIRRFDVLLSLAGEALESPQDLAQAVIKSDGKQLDIEYLRGGKKKSLEVTPEPRLSDGREEVERAMRRWLEQPDRPMSLRFFHPGMIIPPGDARPAALPDDMSVTIEKKGEQPAKILVERGGETWRATEGSLERLPAEARQYVERTIGATMLGPSSFHKEPPRRETSGDDDDVGIEQRLQRKLEQIEALRQKIGDIDELKRQIDELEQLKRQLQR